MFRDHKTQAIKSIEMCFACDYRGSFNLASARCVRSENDTDSGEMQTGYRWILMCIK